MDDVRSLRSVMSFDWHTILKVEIMLGHLGY